MEVSRYSSKFNNHFSIHRFALAHYHSTCKCRSVILQYFKEELEDCDSSLCCDVCFTMNSCNLDDSVILKLKLYLKLCNFLNKGKKQVHSNMLLPFCLQLAPIFCSYIIFTFRLLKSLKFSEATQVVLTSKM